MKLSDTRRRQQFFLHLFLSCVFLSTLSTLVVLLLPYDMRKILDEWLQLTIPSVIVSGTVAASLIWFFLRRYRSFSAFSFFALIMVISFFCMVFVETLSMDDFPSACGMAMLIALLHSALRRRFKTGDILLVFIFTELSTIQDVVLGNYSVGMAVAFIVSMIVVYVYSRYYLYCLCYLPARIALYSGERSYFMAVAVACTDCFCEFCRKLSGSIFKGKSVKRFLKDYGKALLRGIVLFIICALCGGLLMAILFGANI